MAAELAARGGKEEEAREKSGPLVVEIHGNIGAWKTSVIGHLRAMYEGTGKRVRVITEDVDSWTFWMKRLYEEGKGPSAAMELAVLSSFVSASQEILELGADTEVVIVERGPQSMRDVFIPVGIEAGTIDSETGNAFRRIADRVFFAEDMPWQQTRTVYLRCQPADCMRHIQTRARASEATITRDYIDALHAQHEAVFGGADKVIDIGKESSSSINTAMQLGDWIETLLQEKLLGESA
jgi:deoxyadenosine/deoxycytidine kinase